MRKILLLILVLLLVIISTTLGCGKKATNKTPVPSPTSVAATNGLLDHIVVTPSAASIQVDSTQVFNAEGYDKYNNLISGLTFTWNSNAEAGSINSSTGVFTAGHTAGSYSDAVQAVSGSINGGTTMTITPGSLDHIAINPTNATVVIFSTQIFRAQGCDKYGNAINGLTYSWTTNVAADPSDSSKGVYTANHTSGGYTDAIQVTSGSVSGNAQITITAEELDHIVISPSNPSILRNSTQKFTADGYDKYGNVINGLPFTWSADAHAGSIDSSTGVFTAGYLTGNYSDVILATNGSMSSSTGVTITKPVFAKPSKLTMLSITKGDVYIMKANTTSWVQAAVGMTLDINDTLRTDYGWVLITFFDGSTIELEPDTEISVIELGIATDTGSTAIGVGQQIGRTVSRVKKLADTASSYEVKTPVGVGAVRGSTMLVQVSPDGTTAVGNATGTISAFGQGLEVHIPKDMQSIIRRNRPPDKPIPGLPFIPSEGNLWWGNIGKFAIGY
jgi:hypothetical protein